MAGTITLVRFQLACRDLVKDMGSIPMTKAKAFKRVLSLVTEGHDRPESTATPNAHSA